MWDSRRRRSQPRAQSASAPGPSARRRHAGATLPAAGLVPLALLEGGDGAHPGGAAVLGQDHLRQRHRGERAGGRPRRGLAGIWWPPRPVRARREGAGPRAGPGPGAAGCPAPLSAAHGRRLPGLPRYAVLSRARRRLSRSAELKLCCWAGTRACLPLLGGLVGETAEPAVHGLASVLCPHKPLCANGAREGTNIAALWCALKACFRQHVSMAGLTLV